MHPCAGLIAPALLAITVLASSGALADQREPIDISQAALGNSISDITLTDTRGETRQLHDFLGKPVAISLIYTACSHSCSVTTRHLNKVVQMARHSLGQDRFTMLTIGFDHPADTPETMAHYARRHGVTDPNWHFLSSDDPQALETLMEELGFVYESSPRGFDHTVQVSLLESSGELYRQVYGEIFDAPLLVEPLKDLVLNRPASDEGFLAQLGNRIRMFCTVYDAKGDRYYFDYSMFMGIAAGGLFIALTITWLGLEIRRRRWRPAS